MVYPLITLVRGDSFVSRFFGVFLRPLKEIVTTGVPTVIPYRKGVDNVFSHEFKSPIVRLFSTVETEEFFDYLVRERGKVRAVAIERTFG